MLEGRPFRDRDDGPAGPSHVQPQLGRAKRGREVGGEPRSSERINPEGSDEHGCDLVGEHMPDPLGRAVMDLHGDALDRVRRSDEGARIRLDHRHATAQVVEAAGHETSPEVARLVARRRRPDVRPPVEAGEQDEQVRQARIERGRVVRQPHPGQAVPERVPVTWIVEQDRVADVPDESSTDGVGAGLVPRQEAHRLRIEVDPAVATALARDARRHDRHDRPETSLRNEAYRCAGLPPIGAWRPREEALVRQIRLVGLVSVAVLALAACSSNASPAASAAASAGASAAASSAASGDCPKAPDGTAAIGAVTVQDFKFAPETVTIKAGETVGWTNNDTAGHTATTLDGACNTGTIAKGTTVVLTFAKAGTYKYHCTIHSDMPTATVEVTG